MNRANPRREALKRELRSRLVPRLAELGFQSVRTREGRSAWPKMLSAGYDFARRRGDQDDLIAVAWEKHGDPWFSIFFTTKPADAPFNDGRAVSGEVQPVMASKFLRQIKFQERWFGRGHSPKIAVDLAISGIYQLDAYLRTGAGGPQVIVTATGGQLVPPAKMNRTDRLLTVALAILVVPVALLRGVFASVSESLARSRFRSPNRSTAVRRSGSVVTDDPSQP